MVMLAIRPFCAALLLPFLYQMLKGKVTSVINNCYILDIAPDDDMGIWHFSKVIVFSKNPYKRRSQYFVLRNTRTEDSDGDRMGMTT